MRLLKTRILEKKANSPVKKLLWPIFLVASNAKNVNNHLIRVQNADKFCASYEFVSIWLMRLLKTHYFEKKSKLSSEEKNLAYFSRIIEFDKTQGWFVRVQKVLWQLLWKLQHNFYLATPRRLLKKKFWKGKVKISSEQTALAFFFSYYRVWQISLDVF